MNWNHENETREPIYSVLAQNDYAFAKASHINKSGFVLHTKFDLKTHTDLVEIIEQLEGVEPRYRVSKEQCHYEIYIPHGEAFNQKEIAQRVLDKIEEYFNEKEDRNATFKISMADIPNDGKHHTVTTQLLWEDGLKIKRIYLDGKLIGEEGK